jgi:hypothetical protein
MATDLVAGDTGSVLRVTLKDNETGAPVPGLASSTVRMKYRARNGPLTTRQMNIQDAPNAIVTYQFVAGELIAGPLTCEFEVTDASGQTVTSLQEFDLTVRPKL